MLLPVLLPGLATLPTVLALRLVVIAVAFIDCARFSFLTTLFPLLSQTAVAQAQKEKGFNRFEYRFLLVFILLK